MNLRYNYTIIDGENQTVIETEATIEQFELAIKLAKTLVDYNTEDVVNILKSMAIFTEYIAIDRHFNW